MGIEDEELGEGIRNQNPNSNPNHGGIGNEGLGKGKSCTGYLYYSSVLRSKSQNPTCIGISRSLQQGKKLEAAKEDRSLTDFEYHCVGHSVYLDNKGTSDDPLDKAELPPCIGLSVLLDRSGLTADHVPAHVHKSEEDHGLPQPRTYRPANFLVDEYYNRFVRNSGLVASGVAKNVKKVGNHVKETVEDMLYPFRRK